jgi:DNA-binding transcriptional ArsR family regulator
LGNPLAYSIVTLLAQTKAITPSQIARSVGRSLSRVSHVLAALRMMELVRYDPKGKKASYRLKHPRETRQVIAALERFVESASLPNDGTGLRNRANGQPGEREHPTLSQVSRY